MEAQNNPSVVVTVTSRERKICIKGHESRTSIQRSQSVDSFRLTGQRVRSASVKNVDQPGSDTNDEIKAAPATAKKRRQTEMPHGLKPTGESREVRMLKESCNLILAEGETKRTRHERAKKKPAVVIPSPPKKPRKRAESQLMPSPPQKPRQRAASQMPTDNFKTPAPPKPKASKAPPVVPITKASAPKRRRFSTVVGYDRGLGLEEFPRRDPPEAPADPSPTAAPKVSSQSSAGFVSRADAPSVLAIDSPEGFRGFATAAGASQRPFGVRPAELTITPILLKSILKVRQPKEQRTPAAREAQQGPAAVEGAKKRPPAIKEVLKDPPAAENAQQGPTAVGEAKKSVKDSPAVVKLNQNPPADDEAQHAPPSSSSKLSKPAKQVKFQEAPPAAPNFNFKSFLRDSHSSPCGVNMTYFKMDQYKGFVNMPPGSRRDLKPVGKSVVVSSDTTGEFVEFNFISSPTELLDGEGKHESFHQPRRLLKCYQHGNLRLLATPPGLRLHAGERVVVASRRLLLLPRC